jgi:lipopolysaccharide export system protein LptA
MKSPVTLPALLALFALTTPATAPALKSDRDQPADIQSRELDADERTEIAIYQGGVRYRQGSRRIGADRLEVKSHDDEVESARAWGRPLTIDLRPERSQQDAHATAERLEYRKAEDVLELFDAVTLRHRPDGKDDDVRVTADRMIYRAGDDTVELHGRVILQQGGDLFSGGYAFYDLQADRVRVRGGPHTDARVYAVIHPRKKSTEPKP